ncbi:MULTISPECIES: DNA recombination protein RmuC [unclassified Carboxydocella]|uniref:DNA recombination protein RmuC n=1 Tax=unclassified Carboxydocella TaxID=2685367 RepID=UPI0009AD928B|nr:MULTISPECIES: DNA recombination protein RmuC [unclassified Carboxydocella]GAW28325.1 DNA recombination protein RmuC [Carboxydocella sp. ULO1]GAW31098.1 DNA recombination protein RmuC [Carboxydocella sp. JDF658]
MADSLLLLSMIVSLANLFLIIFLLWRQQDQRREGERQERLMREELARNREELIQAFHSFSQQADRLREGVEGRLRLLQEDNHRQLEKIRQTVDEQLHATLERRLGQSFQLVSERLEQVQKGLGEMQALAAGVGDLKRVLTNVKTRGIWGEVQLAQVLEQLLTREQYAENIVTKAGSNERVEFAIRLPGRERDNQFIWLPIDAKFPLEDYQRLLEAQERGEAALAQEAGKQLELRLKAEAKAIRDKYLDPPRTTDFALLYLPVEGLYAEVLRRPGLYDCLLREYRVVITGPTTLAALLNSLQLGFRTLAIEKRSAEVWQLLGAVKTEFGKFGDLLEKTQKKLQEASNSIETAARKSRTIERKLKDVEAIPVEETGLLK